jgi:hypothetical protein
MLEAAPYAPTGVLKPFGRGLWIVDGPVIRMRWAVGTLPFPTRAAVARLEDGGLWVWSPVPLAPGLREGLRKLGPVRALVAPNRLHVSWMAEWRAAFPEAESWGARGTQEAAARMGRGGPARVLGEAAPGAWAGEIEQEIVPGAFMDEAVFLHRASRTLIVADLIENFEAGKISGPGARALMRAGGVLAPRGSTPRDLRLTFLPHRARVRAAVRRMLAWRPERVVMAHGAPITAGADAALRRAFRWTGI